MLNYLNLLFSSVNVPCYADILAAVTYRFFSRKTAKIRLEAGIRRNKLGKLTTSAH